MCGRVCGWRECMENYYFMFVLGILLHKHKVVIPMGVGKEGADTQILSSCYYVYKQLPQRTSKFRRAREEKNSFQVISSAVHIQKSKLRSVQIYEFGSRYVQQT